jgi:DDE superfamily endonuclease
MLGVTMAGEFLPPFVIFAGKDDARTGGVLRELQNAAANGYPDGAHYTVQEKAWMNEKKMLEWVEKVWKPFTLTKEGVTYLIMDEFGAHKTANVLAAIRACGTEIDFIPRGYTSQLQAMDVGLNKPFKDRYRAQHNSFMMQNPTGTKARRQEVARWVVNSWRSLSVSAVTNTWRHIFNRDDGQVPNLNTRNELVHEEDDDLFLDNSSENQTNLRTEIGYNPSEGPGEIVGEEMENLEMGMFL